MKRLLQYTLSIFLVSSLIQAQELRGKAAENRIQDAKIVILNGKSDFPRHIQFKEGSHVSAQDFFARYKVAGKLSQDDELIESRKMQDLYGMTHYRFQQRYKGLDVIAAEYLLHEKKGRLKSANGNLISDLDLNVNPSLDEASAFSRLQAKLGKSFKRVSEKHYLAIASKQYQMTKESMRLVYRFDVFSEKPLAAFYVDIDAHSGEIVNQITRLHTTDVAATGSSLYDGTVNITADQVSASNYRLRQAASGGGIETFNANNSTNYTSPSGTDITSTSSHFTSDDTGVQAHYGAERTYQYYLTKHGRNSYNGSGGKINSYVHFDNNYVNAFWYNDNMFYGDGDGTSYGPLVALDIAGHELSHGVTEYSASLVYQSEEGALNESFSDIFGESIENFARGSNDWQMGTEIGIGGSGALRSMNNPNAHGDPDTYQGTNWANTSNPNRFNDYGGVHTNSGVQNKWFYILTAGESGTNDNGDSYSVSGIGIDKAGAIAYRNLTVYLSANSQYSDARTGAIQAAVDLYGSGSAEEIATTNAWYAVGVGAAYSGGGDTTPPVISGISTTAITSSGADISWTTDEAATSQIEYGTTSSYGSTTSLNSSLVTSHSQSLSGLTASTTYHYRVISTDGSGNTANSSDQTFTTSGSTGGSGDVEPNDGFSTASSLTPETTINGYISSSTDDDYFVFTTSEAGDIHVELANFSGDYDVYLYNSSQSELGKGYTLNDPEIVDYTASSAGTFYVRVDGYNGASSTSDDYELTVTFMPSGSGGTPQWYYVDMTIQSPHKYPNNYNFTETYTQAGASQVAVHFSKFQTESNYDYVYIKDGSGSTVDTYHGTLSAFWAIVSGDEIRVNLVSDYSVRKYGYKIDQVAYYSDHPLTVNGFINGNEVLASGETEVHINNEKGKEIDPFAVKADQSGSDTKPSEFTLDGAYPNPFNPTSNIRFFIAKNSHVKVEIMNSLGQVVKTLLNKELDGDQYHQVKWDASNNSGQKVSSGMYFYRVKTNQGVKVDKLVLLK